MANSWLRLWHDMPNDPKWRTIARASKQPISLVISVYLHVIVNASNATERGRTQNLCSEDLASALDVSTAQIEDVLEAMQGRVLDGDSVSGWSKRQVDREDGSAERAKAWREAQKQQKRTQPNATERTANANELQIRLDTDKDKDTEKKRKEEERRVGDSDESPSAARKTRKSFTKEDAELAQQIADAIRAVIPNARPPSIESWANDVRLIRERDGRTHEQIAALFAWANADGFWAANILSPAKLREKWTTLEAQRARGNRKPETVGDYNRRAMEEFLQMGKTIEGETA